MVRRTVETVTPHAVPLVKLVRQTVEKRLARKGGVESGVEDRDMRHSRKNAPRFANAEEVDRIVQGGERTKRFELSQDRVVDQRRIGEFLSAMDDAVPDDGDCSGVAEHAGSLVQ
jgi:hypothetical protein